MEMLNMGSHAPTNEVNEPRAHASSSDRPRVPAIQLAWVWGASSIVAALIVFAPVFLEPAIALSPGAWALVGVYVAISLAWVLPIMVVPAFLATLTFRAWTRAGRGPAWVPAAWFAGFHAIATTLVMIAIRMEWISSSNVAAALGGTVVGVAAATVAWRVTHRPEPVALVAVTTGVCSFLPSVFLLVPVNPQHPVFAALHSVGGAATVALVAAQVYQWKAGPVALQTSKVMP